MMSHSPGVAGLATDIAAAFACSPVLPALPDIPGMSAILLDGAVPADASAVAAAPTTRSARAVTSPSDAMTTSVYGPAANPHGHGHNYEVELTVCGTVNPVTGRVVDPGLLDELAEKQILGPFRYRNLNEEVAVFRTAVPTTAGSD